MPVSFVFHPTEESTIKFKPNLFKVNEDKQAVFIGHWLRKFESLWKLKTPYRKVILEYPGFNYQTLKLPKDPNVHWESHLGNLDYDLKLAENIVFLDVHDASANNVVIECMARNNPLIVKKTPAIVEYMGEDYPMYFEDLEEASEKMNEDQILEGHKYLEDMDKSKIKFNRFIKDLSNSKVFQSIRPI